MAHNLQILLAAVIRQELPELLQTLALNERLYATVKIEPRNAASPRALGLAHAKRKEGEIVDSSICVYIYLERSIEILESGKVVCPGLDTWEHFLFILAHEYRHVWQYLNKVEPTEEDANRFAYSYVLSTRLKSTLKGGDIL